MRHLPPWTALAVALALGLAASSARPDVYVLRGGDRITAEPLLEGKRSFKVKTPYGVLTIPRSKVERVIRADGTEQVVNPEVASPKPVETVATLPPARRARLILIITGKTFWQAWDPKTRPAPDPTLRLAVSLDEEVVATYTDAKIDPEIKGAVANSFSFAPEDVAAAAGERVLLSPPEVRPGRIALKIDVPTAAAPGRLRIAYQVNEGSATEPAWRDLATGSTDVDLRADVPTFVKVEQDVGRMEFSGFPRRRMKFVETFHLELGPGHAEDEPPLTP